VRGDLAALVSEVPLTDYDDDRIREHLNDLAWVERTARLHEAVLDAALANTTIVPLRLCTIYRDRAGVEAMLDGDRATLASALNRLRGRSEWGLKVFAHRARVEEAVAGAVGGGADPAESEAAGYLRRKREERESGDRVDRLAAACAEACHGALAGVATAARVNPVQRPEAHGRDAEMVLNGVYLVDEDARNALRAQSEELRDEYGPLGFEIELTGPWPAYNFVVPEGAPAP
jgi:hypothetical protein